MKIQYHGQYSAVEIPAFGITAVNGEPFDVTDEQAESLLSGEFSVVESKKEAGK